MPIATEVKKLADSKPFYAVAGAGDFAVEKLLELPERIQRLQSRREEIREAAKDLPEKARELAGKAEGYAKDFPVKARDYADQFAGKATELYEEFANRGRKVVSKTSSEAALELEELSQAARPRAVTTPKKSTRTSKSGTSKA
ncbi:hypothetical protein OG884_21055 [Streptosporangium sp. NBC_01755]|uniref:hypothetical protein n=1 Tax=unclassified Streptosporangium TaxID=2632669 RepID=UPI002DD8D344|nr:MULTISPECIES: hypothetical protein [unclassified Streptosporangium]WSA24541.1 hypothetical protein OIE13_26865 [Streptosporangium sp. NBC_01810]WSC97384.1 hypothetical protein OG884_21055 [Streptosporangium sp. NBC_01755]